MTTYAVGDVQGCYAALRCVLKEVAFNPAKDALWLVGDLVNRGPQSLEVLRFAQSLGKRGKVVLGNHDLHLLAVAEGSRKTRTKDSLDAILDAPDREELLDWLRHQPLIYTDNRLGYTMVHAGIPPIWSLSKAHSLAREVEAALRSDRRRRFLGGMYGNDPLCWNNNLSGIKRLRVITNYLTRMRFCCADGTLDLEDSDSKVSSRPGFRPWFDHKNPALNGHQLIFGHWAALEGVTRQPDVHALDTGCVWGGRLTLLRLNDQTRISCACQPTLPPKGDA